MLTTDRPSDYITFLQGKRQTILDYGMHVDPARINPLLFPFQRQIVLWALRRGRAALFEACGLGKTFQQIEWARIICEETQGDVFILAPLAVSQQTVREGRKLGVPITLCRSQADVRPGINISNYEMLEHFRPEHFEGVVLDESGILKSYMGTTKRRLVEAFANTPFRLCCTATPAPNDHTELGNHSEFLGIMPSNEMLSRWFINDTKRTGVYRLKKHAQSDFWDWVASWGIAIELPSDIGGDDDGFVLPDLRMHHLTVEVDLTDPTGQQLFRTPEMSATTLHREMRLTAKDRAAKVAELVNGSTEPWLIFCHTNYEADELMQVIPRVTDLRGSETLVAKERKILGFLDGSIQILQSKGAILGFGLNLQHCHNVAFVGLSYSFEEMYQAIRRVWRYGQQQPVDVYLVAAQTEGVIQTRLQEKMDAHREMVEAMRESTAKQLRQANLQLIDYDPRAEMEIPEWLVSIQ